MSGMIVRLAGPMQSWGERSAFGSRDTLPFPTRSGLVGMFAAAQGQPRTAGLEDYAPLEFTVRIDRPGRLLEDFHTVGGGLPATRTLPTSEGKRRSPDSATLISRRHYLTDAVFVVAVTGPQGLIGDISQALETPVWAPSLGRRACVPDEPLVLRSESDDPIRELRERVPLSLPDRPTPGHKTIPIDFVWENPPQEDMGGAHRYQTSDVPLSFIPGNRRFGTRPLWRAPEHLPAALYAAPPTYQALIDYAVENGVPQEPT